VKDYLNYAGKTSVVFGGSKGMGRACVDMLVELGSKVYVLDILPCDKKDIDFIQVDASDEASVKAAFDKIPAFDKFFGFAGISGAGQPICTTIAINFLSYKYMFDNVFYDKMPDEGSIAIVASVASNGWDNHIDEYEYVTTESRDKAFEFLKLNEKYLDGNPENGAYVLSKRLLAYYCFVNGEKYAKKGIRINVVCPGFTDTGLRSQFANFMNNDENFVREMFWGYYPYRDGKPEEMASACVFLNSDMAGYINCSRLLVEAGCDAKERLKLRGVPGFKEGPLFTEKVKIP